MLYSVYGIFKRHVCYLYALGSDTKTVRDFHARTCKNDTVPMSPDASLMLPVATSDTDRVFSIEQMP